MFIYFGNLKVTVKIARIKKYYTLQRRRLIRFQYGGRLTESEYSILAGGILNKSISLLLRRQLSL